MQMQLEKTVTEVGKIAMEKVAAAEETAVEQVATEKIAAAEKID